jgi:hypothetical protein
MSDLKELLDRINESAAALSARRKPPIKGAPELYQGRYWITLEIHDWDGFRIEIFSDTYTQGVELKVAARIKDLTAK